MPASLHAAEKDFINIGVLRSGVRIRQPESFDWALEHAVNHGDTTMFPLPFEYHAIKHDWANVRSFLEQHDILIWTVRPHRTMLAPKSSYAFRVITQLDPLDFLVYAALIKELGSDLEKSRPYSPDAKNNGGYES